MATDLGAVTYNAVAAELDPIVALVLSDFPTASTIVIRAVPLAMPLMEKVDPLTLAVATPVLLLLTV